MVFFTWLTSRTWFPSVMSRLYCCERGAGAESLLGGLSAGVVTGVSTYSLVVVLEGNIRVSPLEGVVRRVIPRYVVDPVGFVVVPKRLDQTRRLSLVSQRQIHTPQTVSVPDSETTCLVRTMRPTSSLVQISGKC